MTERDFLAAYDATAFTPLAVTTDVVLFAVDGTTLNVLLVRRGDYPSRGMLALPGTFVRANEDLDAAAIRALGEKVGVAAPVRQFETFGKIDRDPRMRIISVGYMAMLPFAAVTALVDETRQLAAWRPDGWYDADGARLTLPFDHMLILEAAHRALRAELDTHPWAFGLLAPTFSLRELQEVHEAVRGQSLNKPAFRKRLIESGRIEPTGVMETGKGFRPAELYRVREEFTDAAD